MSPLLFLLVIALALFLSGVFSGSESGLYSVSKPRVQLEADEGLRGGRVLRRCLEARSALLVTILIGNNVALEVMTLAAEGWLDLAEASSLQRDLTLSLVLTPGVFLFGELLPKDLFRRRPHVLMRSAAPLLAAARWVFWPLGVLLLALSRSLERLAGLEPERLSQRPRRAEVLSVLAEGRAVGALEPHAEELARNALGLRALSVTRAMLPWETVATLDADEDDEALRRAVAASCFTRLPVTRGGRVEGYVHQLEVLAAGAERPVLEAQEEILFVDPESSVDRALSRLRHRGRRMAVVGSPEAPLGLVTLKDLLEEISGDLGGW